MTVGGRAEVWFDRADAVRRLGSRWVRARARDAFRQASGHTRRATPGGPWVVEGPAPPSTTLVDAQSLRTWLGAHTGPAGQAELVERRSALEARNFEVFGTRLRLANWHHDPVSGANYDPSRHWSRIAEQRGADLKCVWEPSRFGWAFDLARLHLLDPAAGAADTFEELLGDWMQSNPPNLGVNWYCGQEASVRLLAVVMAAEAMGDGVSAEGWGRVEALAAATGARVVEHIGYARSQRNNHLSSEAMGLAIAAAVAPNASGASDWRRVSDRSFDEVAAELILPDGGSSQYSTNYHRVFVHALAVREILAIRRGDGPTSTRSALDRAARFLGALMVTASGDGSFHGHDDGANLLPLSSLGHRNLADAIDLASAVVASPASGVTAARESAAWFGLEVASKNLRRPVDRVEHFPDAGVHVAARGPITVVVRAGPTDFRPAHADQLNVDVWSGDANVAVDRATASYTADPDGPDRFAQSRHHNTIVLENEDHMPRVSRFLWSRWVSGSLDAVVVDEESVEMRFCAAIGRSRVTATRRVLVRSDLVEIDDRVEGDRAWATHWQLDPAAVLMLEPEPGDRVELGVERARSYRQLSADLKTVIRLGSPHGVRSRFVPGGPDR